MGRYDIMGELITLCICTETARNRLRAASPALGVHASLLSVITVFAYQLYNEFITLICFTLPRIDTFWWHMKKHCDISVPQPVKNKLVMLYVKTLCDGIPAGRDTMNESRTRKEIIDAKLNQAGWDIADRTQVVEAGSEYISSDRISSALTSVELKVKPKINNIAGLQLADLVAHSSRREILLENGRIERTGNREFGDRIIEILQKKYDTDRERIFGKKMLP